ncbi:glutamine synthetase [Candidatus Omnitrophus magneticus]|nr:glutamine synthetase [Candidatus Omnitrophus magneticus]KJJ85891.1 glutamine synthetase [Candidatus Omnitrophus magneticus]
MLRAAVASAGNDHRLGANEAPPAIVSIFLGDQLTDIMQQLEKGRPNSSKAGGIIEIGVSSLPKLPKDVTDRNRTSPFAFTGNKFEFRAVGSSQSCSGANIVINTIFAEAVDEICSELETAVSKGKNFNDTLQGILQGIVKKHKRIIFNGDNYSAEWTKEAEKRGLPNLRNTPDTLEVIEKDKKYGALFEKYGVLTKEEFKSRNDVYHHAYEMTIAMEANCAITIAKTLVIPAALEYQGVLAETIQKVGSISKKITMLESKKLLVSLVSNVEEALAAVSELEASVASGKSAKKTIASMVKLREAIDALEGIIPKDKWPLPTYAEMMFMM